MLRPSDYLTAVAARYQVKDFGRHWVAHRRHGIDIGIDELKRDGIRSVHVFGDHVQQAKILTSIGNQVRDTATKAEFVDRRGIRPPYRRRYVGWEWPTNRTGTFDEQVAMACNLIDRLITARNEAAGSS